MPSNNSKYTQEIRERTAKFILENGRSATSVAEEMGIGVDTVCRWVREYRRKYDLPSYAEEKGIKRREPQTEGELLYRIKELEKELKQKEKALLEWYGKALEGMVHYCMYSQQISSLLLSSLIMK